MLNKRSVVLMGSGLWLWFSVGAWARQPEVRGQGPANIPPAQRCSAAAKKKRHQEGAQSALRFGPLQSRRDR